MEKFGGYKTEVKEILEKSERQALKNKVKEEKHLKIYRGLREDIGMKTYLHRPMDYAKKLKLRFRAGDLDLPENTKEIRYMYRSWKEEDMAMPVWHNIREQDSHSRRM